MHHVTQSTHRPNKTKMAAAFQKRRAGLVAILKHSLATVAPVLYNKGLISDKDRETAMNDSVSKRERAESLVAMLGNEIQANQEALKEFLSILQEAGVGHTYVVIMENELRNPQRSSVVSVRKDTHTHVAQVKRDEETTSKGSEHTDFSQQRQEAELISQTEL